jgi:hypothetical protein
MDKRCVSFLVTANTGLCTTNNDEGSTPDVSSNDLLTDPSPSETPLDKRCVSFLVTANTGSCTANNDKGSTPDISSNDPLTDPPPSETPLDKRYVSFLVTTNTGSYTTNNNEGSTPDVSLNDPPLMNNDTLSTDDALLLTVSFPYHSFMAKYIHDRKPNPPGGKGFVLHYIDSCFDSAGSMLTMTDPPPSETPLDKRCVILGNCKYWLMHRQQ